MSCRLAFLVLLLSASSLLAAVTAVRTLPNSHLSTGGPFTVTIEIAISDAAPTGLILSETLPTGWTITAATFGANPFMPVLIGDQAKWLFGGPNGVVPATGNLTLTVDPTGNTALGAHSFAGSLKYFDDGSEQTVATSGDDIVTILPPTTVSGVDVQSGDRVRVTFSAAVGSSATVAGNYSLSGSGSGTLTANPDQVSQVSATEYDLIWLNGEMWNGGDIVISVSGVSDAAGHGIGTPNAGQDSGAAVGTAPTITAQVPTPDSFITSSSQSLDVTFSETVQGVDAGDLVLTGAAAAGANVGSVANVSGDLWRFEVSGLVTGPLQISLADSADDIEDLAGNDLAPSSWAYTVDVDAPTVTLVNPTDNAVLTRSELDVNITFSETVTDVDITDLVLSGIAANTASVQSVSNIGGNVYRFVVIDLVTGDVNLSLAPDLNDIRDLAGNPLQNVTWAYGIDVDAPVLSGIEPAASSIVHAVSVDVDLTFSEPITGLDTTDFILAGANAGATIGAPVDTGGNTWRITISGLIDGSLSISLAPDADDVEDLAGNDFANQTWSYAVVVPIYHPFDSDTDWVLSDDELTAMKSAWQADSITLSPGVSDADFYVLWSIELWQAGAYRHDFNLAGYRIWQPNP